MRSFLPSFVLFASLVPLLSAGCQRDRNAVGVDGGPLFDGSAVGPDAGVPSDAGPAITRLETMTTDNLTAVDALGSDLFVATEGGAILVSRAGGPFERHPLPLVPVLVGVRAFASARIAWSYGAYSMYYETDGVWRESAAGFPRGPSYTIVGVSEESGRLSLAISADGIERGYRHQIVSSTDRGASWSVEAEWTVGPPIALFTLGSRERVLLSSQGELGRIRGGTVEWGPEVIPFDPVTTDLSTGAGFGDVLLIATRRWVSESESRVVLFRSDDGGASFREVWENVGTRPALFDIVGSADDFCFRFATDFGEARAFRSRAGAVEEVLDDASWMNGHARVPGGLVAVGAVGRGLWIPLSD